tara:strand:+ start:2252 stop:2653 length:402 start_codon:yes stop_codon:yes gene_type:complete
MPITFNVTIIEEGRPDITRNLTRGVDATSDAARNAAARAALIAQSTQDKDLEDAPPSVNTNLSVSPIVTILSNQYIATINPGLDGEIPGNDVGLDRGMTAGLVNLTLSRIATQDVGINLGLPSNMSTSSDFDA